MDEKQRYDEGLKVRRAVLGDAHVDRSLNALTEFNSEFQEMITRHAWGDIWTRPGLERHTRSLITIAMLIGMNRNEELKLHLRAAANNGVTRGEIKEVMGDVQEVVPVFKNLPLDKMLDAVITKEIVALEKAIEAKDLRKFVAGYDKLNAACNACHQGTENGFVVIQRPTLLAFTNQNYRPHK